MFCHQTAVEGCWRTARHAQKLVWEIHSVTPRIVRGANSKRTPWTESTRQLLALGAVAQVGAENAFRHELLDVTDALIARSLELVERET